MAEEVKQEEERNLAAEEKKSVKVVVKKRVRKTTPKKDSSDKKASDSSDKPEEIAAEKEETPKKTRKRTTKKKVSKTTEEDQQLELKLEEPEVSQEKPKKAKTTRKKVQVKKDLTKQNPKEDSTSALEIKETEAVNGENEESLKKTVSKRVPITKSKSKTTTKTENSEESNLDKTNKTEVAQNSQTDEVKKTADSPKAEERVQRDNSQTNRRNNSRNNNSNNNNNRRNNSQRNNRNKNNKKHYEERIEEVNLDENPDAPTQLINDYYYMSFDLLRTKGIEVGMNAENIFDYKRQEIITEILKAQCQKNIALVVEGTLEVLPDGYGFLRSSRNSYISGPEDIYVSSNLIRHNALKTGDLVFGQVKTPRDTERFYGLHRILKVNNDELIKAKKRPSFDSLTPRFPDERMRLENSSEDISTRLIDMFCPIGKGQRSLIVAPPRTGKTVLMQKIANAISENYPEISLIVLLVDERPEEVTDMRDNVKGEVIASTFDEQATRHVQVAEMAIEKAKRMVEANKDVVILLDSITRLARAYNQTVPASGKILSGGVDSNALHKPKRFFGAARNMEGGGSLTIIATALIETGSRMDEVIFEEFKGTGNNEIVLDRRLSDRRIFPSINLKKSGTRRDDLLIPSDEAQRIWIIRNAINDMDEVDQTPFLIDKMRKAKNNEAFFKSINTAIAK
ncbi:MAG: transcription termination factor Rho [Sphaerochaetaceae bacterium]|nr:transcription termination factor Rho [Sphaerochaetaceae bacterium]MDC7236662.1 transcription termination factor Rho [Sphaerochaetaceae bacterium]